jgi:hypothetical protein
MSETRIHTVTGHTVTTVAWNDGIEPGEYDGKISVDVLAKGAGFFLRADDAEALADELHERVTELRNNAQQYAQQ